jgi:hypothetical protein
MKNAKPYLLNEYSSIIRLTTRNIEDFAEFFKEEYNVSRKNSEKNDINYYRTDNYENRTKQYYSFHVKNKQVPQNNSEEFNKSELCEKKFGSSIKKEGRELYLSEL